MRTKPTVLFTRDMESWQVQERDHPLAVLLFTAIISIPTACIWASVLGAF